MGGIFAPGLQIRENAVIRRTRELSLPGTLLVKQGDRVDQETVVARAELAGELHILRVAEALGIEPPEACAALRVREGDAVQEGGIIAEHSGLFGLFRSRFQSPVSGAVELVTPETGHVAVRSAPKPIELRAYLQGTVVELVSGRSVTIEASVGFFQGIFGVGGERSGTIRALDLGVGERITPAKLPPIAPGDILVGGTRPSAEALAQAQAGGASGFVVGALDDRALAAFLGFDLGVAVTGDEAVTMSVIMTEGFGEIPMSEKLFALLEKCHGKRASLNGATQVRAGAVRPEIIVFHDGASAASTAVQAGGGALEIGVRVRIVRVPYFGAYGEIVELPRELQALDTGAHARVLRARLEDGRVVTVPRANVELT